MSKLGNLLNTSNNPVLNGIVTSILHDTCSKFVDNYDAYKKQVDDSGRHPIITPELELFTAKEILNAIKIK